MAPSGFVQRWKGKIAPNQVNVGPGGVIYQARTEAPSTGSSAAMLPGGVSILNSTVAALYAIAPPIPGVSKSIIFTSTANSSAIAIVALSTGVPVTFDGANGYMKGFPSPCPVLDLIGVSSVRWAVQLPGSSVFQSPFSATS